MRKLAGKLMLGVVCAAVAGAAEPAHYAASRAVLVEFAEGDAAPVDDVLLWYSRDLGRTWRRAEIERVAPHTVRFEAPDDGEYALYVVLKNAGGVSGDPPASGTIPHDRVIVDTNPPLVQVHSAVAVRLSPDGTDKPGAASSSATDNTETAAEHTPTLRVRIRASILDEHLGPGALRIFYRAKAADPWIDGGLAESHADELSWRVPSNIEKSVELRLCVTDRAGNRTTEDVPPIALPQPESPTSQPAAQTPDEKPQNEADTADSAPDEQKSAKLDPQTAEQVARLRLLARKFEVREQYQLAEARLNDALKLAPDNADVLVDLGQISYRLKHFHDAQQHFADALLTAPDDADALSGLALVAATERRYSQAREHLSRLLQLDPQAPTTWLRLGDVEHRLGNRSQAIQAWQKVLELDKPGADTRDDALRRLEYFDPQHREKP